MTKHKPRIFLIAIIIIGILTMSMMYSKIKDNAYRTAITIAEKKFATLKINRDDYKLIAIENNIIKNGESWKFTFLSTGCISKEELRNCMGGEIFITVNIKTKEATIGWGE